MSKRKILSSAVSYMIISLLILYIVFPLFWCFLVSFKNEVQVFRIPLKFWPTPPTLNNYFKLFDRGNMLFFARNSIIVALITTSVVFFLAIPAAYGFAKFKFPAANMLLMLIMLLRMVPGIMFNVPYFLMLQKLSLLNSVPGLALCYISGGALLSIWLLQVSFRAIPVEIEEASIIDGLGVIGRIVKIVIPISMPSIVTALLFVFLGAWNEFLLAATMLKRPELYTIPVGISVLSQALNNRVYWGEIMANATIYIVPVMFATFYFQRGLVQGISEGGVKA